MNTNHFTISEYYLENILRLGMHKEFHRGTNPHIIKQKIHHRGTKFHRKYKNYLYLESQLRARHWKKETWIQMPDSLLPSHVILGKDI